MAEVGLRVAVPFDFQEGPEFDLGKRRVQDTVIKWVREGRIWYLHLGTPCTPWSIARKSQPGRASVKVSREHVRFTAKLIKLCVDLNIYFSLENPKTSSLFHQPEIQEALTYANAFFY